MTYRIFGPAFAALALLAGQAPAQERLTIAISGEIETLDPPFSQFQRSNEVNFNILDQYFRYGWADSGAGYGVADTGKVEGSAFESWDWSDDNRVLTLTLRDGAAFTGSGNPVTASDVHYWFERAFGTDAGTEWNAVTAHIDTLDAVKVIDDRTVEITFSAISPWFFYLFRDQSQAPIEAAVAKEHVTGDDAWATGWLARNSPGSGEYSVAEWEPGIRMTLAANPDYWDGKAFFDEVVLRVVPASANRALLLQSGEVDIARDLSPDELALLRDAPGVKILSVPTRNQMIMGFNTTEPPFDDPAVRQALAWAVPYQAIVDGVFGGQALPSAGPIPVEGQNHDPSLWSVSTDPAKAREMLAEAGHPDGIAFTLDIAEGNPVTEQIAVILKDAFSQAGVDMAIEVQPAAVFAEGLGQLGHQAWMRDLLWYVDDAGYTGELFFRTGAVANWMGYSNPELDAVITSLGATVDPGEKATLAGEYQRILIGDAPSIAIVDMPFEIAMRDDIEGYVQLPDNLLWYWPLRRAQ